MYETVDVVAQESVVTLSLNRPAVRNAFNAVMIHELTDIFRSLGNRDDVRVVVLQGKGACFSAGADAEWMAASLQYSRRENMQDARRMSAMYQAINDAPQPVLARVHGACLGGGMGLIAVCDVVAAADDTLFGFTEARLGIIPAVISRYVLPKIGQSWARALFTSGERFGADLARQIGLVHWICAFEDLDKVVVGKVGHVLSGGPVAVRAAKTLIRDIADCTPSEIDDLAVERIADLRTSPEGQEGLQAFLAKRKPIWYQE